MQPLPQAPRVLHRVGSLIFLPVRRARGRQLDLKRGVLAQVDFLLARYARHELKEPVEVEVGYLDVDRAGFVD